MDEYQDLLRVSVASAANDHRLGGYEAPPAIISLFLGTELTEILEAIESGEAYGSHEKEVLKVGVHTLPRFPKDTTDRNRTSPFAFTGNKFEFRMLGSSASIADANVVINTAVAEALRRFADELEAAEDFESALHELIRRTIVEHRRVIFNGNGYEESWVQEAARRGLLNLPTTPDCAPCLIAEKNVALFARHRVLSRAELESRYVVMLESYAKVLNIEALTMLEMARREILPAVSGYVRELSQTVALKQQLGGNGLNARYELQTAQRLSALCASALEETEALERALEDIPKGDSLARARHYRDRVLASMNALRAMVDEMETLTDERRWPYPSNGDVLFSVK